MTGFRHAAQSATSIEPVNIEMLVDWLDDLWQTDEEIRNSMTEQEFLEFRNSCIIRVNSRLKKSSIEVATIPAIVPP
ncbi:MAG: hypothetical protein A2Y10_14715 [Planctomycetes bacterium GWF2_41_51]|nr:MAG: hypothetical protein A2Y10_14715 [Planctomycetes bacterium GWF2_41_51]HBG25805.1 hypothetical protein [Phycisphaerales bacterium]